MFGETICRYIMYFYDNHFLSNKFPGFMKSDREKYIAPTKAYPKEKNLI